MIADAWATYYVTFFAEDCCSVLVDRLVQSGFIIQGGNISDTLSLCFAQLNKERSAFFFFHLFSWHGWDMPENSADVFVTKSALAGVVIVRFKVWSPRATNMKISIFEHVVLPLCLPVFLFCDRDAVDRRYAVSPASDASLQEAFLINKYRAGIP